MWLVFEKYLVTSFLELSPKKSASSSSELSSLSMLSAEELPSLSRSGTLSSEEPQSLYAGQREGTCLKHQ